MATRRADPILDVDPRQGEEKCSGGRGDQASTLGPAHLGSEPVA